MPCRSVGQLPCLEDIGQPHHSLEALEGNGDRHLSWLLAPPILCRHSPHAKNIPERTRHLKQSPYAGRTLYRMRAAGVAGISSVSAAEQPRGAARSDLDAGEQHGKPVPGRPSPHDAAGSRYAPEQHDLSAAAFGSAIRSDPRTERCGSVRKRPELLRRLCMLFNAKPMGY
jgi:hypothetical protein